MKKITQKAILYWVGCAIFSFMMSGCFKENPVAPQLKINKNMIVATTVSSDYASGNMGIMTIHNHYTQNNLLNLSTDAIVKTYNKSVYVLERLGKDNIIKFTDTLIGASGIAYQKHLGDNIDIADIAFLNDHVAYVSCYMGKNVLVIDPSNGAVKESIDLSGYSAYQKTDSVQAIPYMQSMVIYNSTLYVACQCLKPQGTYNAPSPADTSKIIAISTSNNTISGIIALKKKNPASMVEIDGILYVSSTGSWVDNTDGGIERIDLANKSNLGMVAEESVFNGNISNIYAFSMTKAYVAVGKSDASFNFWTEIIPIDLKTGAISSKIAAIDNAFGGAVCDETYLYVGDRSSTNPGIVVIDPITNKKVAGPFDIGLPPSSIAYLKVNE